MPHLRQRYIQESVRSGLKHKGIVGIFGHRQVGKTTLLEQLSKKYVTLDRSTNLQRSMEAPEDFLESNLGSSLPLAIDECQLSPNLFPALKEYVRTHKQPGIFLLSGSVRFSSRKAIRESLTGRMLAYELLPFSISELEGKALKTLPLDLLRCRGFSGIRFSSSVKDFKNPHILQYLNLGGLPGICFVRNERDRIDIIESQLDLILDRDLKLVCETSLSLLSLKNLVRMLADLQNTPLNLSDLSRKSKISVPTLRKIITGLESIFFIRVIPCEGNEVRPVIFLEDQGEASYLRATRISGNPDYSTNIVSDLERLAFSHLRIPFTYTSGIPWEISQYRQHGGAYVPFVFRAEGKTLGFICMQESSPSLGSSRSAGSFLTKNSQSKLVYLHPGKEIKILNEREIVLPIQLVL
ncbi:MAG: ATP-binding protein [Deltaproteobacteria bacterium]|nr:MAG: ATP-binding protein [Deltaproteobacteria bacterium]